MHIKEAKRREVASRRTADLEGTTGEATTIVELRKLFWAMTFVKS